MVSNRKASLLDDAHLAALGHEAQLNRHFSPLSMLGLAFAILNSWTALAASLSLALPSGGPTSVLWGLITAGVCNICLAASLAEFLSAYPTAGGQYHWVAMIAPERMVPILSWVTGWINVGGWVALTATAGLLGSSLILGIITLENPDFVSHRYQQFLLYVAITLIIFVVNAFSSKILPYVNKAALFWSITGFVVISITLLACSSPNYASAEYVFTSFINETGWPDGIAWLLGLLQGGLGLTAFDAVAHMIEEIPNAAVEGPKIMIYCVLIGIFTGFIFLMVLLFVSGGEANLDTVIKSGAGPLLEIFYTATQNKAGSICLLMFPLVCLNFAGISIMTTTSRMIFAFARDGGLPFSKFFATVNKGLGQPLNALILNTVVVTLFGCIFLGSSAAFNAIISASVVGLSLSYAAPILTNVLQGRRKLPANRAFKIPEPLAWFANLLGLAYVLLTTVLFMFPAALPVTGSSMNYCVVAVAVWMLICAIQWFVDGRKNFKGPKWEVDEDTLIAQASNPDAVRETIAKGVDADQTHFKTAGEMKGYTLPKDDMSKDV